MKVREEGSVGEMKEAGGIVSHRVAGARFVVVARDVTVEPLVDCQESEEVCGRCIRGRAALPLPEEGSKVVGFGQEGAFPDVEVLGGHVQVDEATGKFQVRN